MSGNKIMRLKDQIADHEKRISKLEDIVNMKRQESFPTKEIDVVARLAKKAGVIPDSIREIFDIEMDQLTVVMMKGESTKEKTQSITLLVLLGYLALRNTKEVLSGEIQRNVAENGVPVNNFAAYVNELSPSWVRKKGKPRSKSTSYRLTTLGERRARDIVKEIHEED